jgi:hypothetical protein
VRAVLDLDRGPFLPGEAGLPQAPALADGLRRRLLRAIAGQARHWETADRQKAADWYDEALRAARALMHVYHARGRPRRSTRSTAAAVRPWPSGWAERPPPRPTGC